MMTKRITASKIIFGLLLLFLSVVACFPFVYMFLISLRQTTALDMNFKLSEMSFLNYHRIFKDYSFFTFFKNSLVVSSCACFFNCIIASMAAYGFSKKKFPGKNALFFLYLATLMIPGQVTIISVFMIMNKLHLLNTYPSMILPIINAFGVFLIKQFMDMFPDELLDAASIDGSGEVRKFVSIVLPLIKPALLTLVIFTFITSWNDFIWPLVVVTDRSMQTLTLALSILKGNYITNYGLVMAGSTLTFLPPFILFILFHLEVL